MQPDENNPVVPLASEIPPQDVPKEQYQQQGQYPPNYPTQGNFPQDYQNEFDNISQPLSDAPQSMLQNRPSYFAQNLGQEPKGRRGFKSFCTCCCSIFLILLLGIFGLGAFVYLTDADVPVVSEVIEWIENALRNKEEEAKKMNKQILSTLAGIVLPLARKNEILSNYISKDMLYGDYLSSLVSNYSEIDSFRYDLKIKSEFHNVGNLMNGDVSLNTNINGIMNFKDKDNPLIQANINSNNDFNGVTFKVNGEILSLGDSTYIKLEEYPSNINDVFDLSQYRNKWIEVDSDSMKVIVNSIGIVNLDALKEGRDEDDKLNKEFLNKVIEILTSDKIIKKVEFNKTEKIYGNKCNCAKLNLNGEEFLDIVDMSYEKFGGDYNGSEYGILGNLKNITFEVCVGRKSNIVHKLKVDLIFDKDDENLNQSIELYLWDNNKDLTIPKPEKYESGKELLDKIELELKANKRNDMRIDDIDMIVEALKNWISDNNLSIQDACAQLGIDKVIDYSDGIDANEGINASLVLEKIVTSGYLTGVPVDPEDYEYKIGVNKLENPSKILVCSNKIEFTNKYKEKDYQNKVWCQEI